MFNFWHLGALALRTKRQSTRMWKIKNSGLDQYAAEPFEQQKYGTAGAEGVNRTYVSQLQVTVTTHLENLEKSGNSKVVREKSWKNGKVRVTPKSASSCS